MSGNNKNPHDDFYDDDDKFENFHEEGESDLPEYPTRKHSTSPAQSSHEGQEYQDLNDEQEHEHEHEHDEHPQEDENGGVENDGIPQPKPWMKYLLPVGGSVLAISGAFAAYMTLFSGGSAPQNPVQMPTQQLPALPRPMQAQNAPGPVIPTLPQQNTPNVVMPKTAPVQKDSMGLPIDNTPQTVGFGQQVQNSQPVMSQNPVSSAPQQVSGALEQSLAALVVELKTVNSNFQALNERLASTDNRISEVGNHVNVVDQKLLTIEQRLLVLESRSNNVLEKVSNQTKASEVQPNKTIVAPKVTEVRPSKQEEVKPVAPTPVVASVASEEHVAYGYTLKGLSRDMVLIQTKNGLKTYKIGEEIPGLGIAKEIKADGKTYILVTSGGIIRP